jgi:hypothetical protein
VEEFGVHVDAVWWVMLKVETCFGSFDVCSTSLFYLMTLPVSLISIAVLGIFFIIYFLCNVNFRKRRNFCTCF